MKLIVKLLFGIMLLVFVGCSEYDQGVSAGRKAARDARGELGAFGGAAIGIGLELMSGKIEESKSGEWNAGFRDGYGKEIGTR